jgi:thiol-disulfide isomerase/thioredoxin
MKTKSFVSIFVLAGLAFGAVFYSTSFGAPAEPLYIKHWLGGDPVDLSDGKGDNVFVVEFWATWCPACYVTIPHLSELQRRYEDDGLVVVGVTDEDLELIESFRSNWESPIEYRLAIDDDARTAGGYVAKYGIDYVPSAFVIGRDGRIAWYGHPLDGSFEKAVKAALDRKPSGQTPD